MKTFEERYTAWIDGKLDGPALKAFERELASRSEAAIAEADRAESLRLRDLLRVHLEAPPLDNAEFFSHQLRERITAEQASKVRRPDQVKAGWLQSLFPWSVGQFAGVGAALLFVSAALYYGLEPGGSTGGASRASSHTVASQSVPVPAASTQNVVEPANVAPVAARSGPPQYVMLATPTPTPDLSLDIQVHDTPGASATALHYPKPNVNVLWTNGLPYISDLSAASPAPSAAPSPNNAP